MSGGLEALTIVTALGSAMVGGIFFPFSTFAMAGLRRLPDSQGAAAMQSINVTAPTPLFMSILFGMSLPSIAVAVAGVANLSESYGPWLLAGGLAYLVSAPIVTMVFNVPLNNELAGSAEAWGRYQREWTAWNHVRTVVPLVASAALIIALIA
jgi:uncharacterized membrane protein